MSIKHLSLLILLLTIMTFSACSQETSKPELKLTKQKSGTDALLIGVSAANENVVWIGGAEGTILRTIDGGKTWESRPIPGTDTLQFRDVQAVDANTAYVLSIGNGTNSRIYKTIDGGKSWKLQFKSSTPKAFLDCMAFWNPKTGIAFSDAVDGELFILKTTNGGETWNRIPQNQLPPAQPNEGSFAASGTCVTSYGASLAWIGTGNTVQPRVLFTSDGGQTWQTFPVPLDAGTGAGTASVIFRDAKHGMALGGDIAQPATSDSTAAITTDGGVTWKLVTNPPLDSPVYGSAYIPGTQNVVAVGPGGVAFSPDEGTSWSRADTLTMWGVTFATANNGWIVGPNGRIFHVYVK